MKNEWESNFKEVQHGNISIKHHSTSSTIEVISFCSENLNPHTSLYLDYSDFDSLIECINRLRPSNY